MGKGDKRSKRGKIWRGTCGKSRGKNEGRVPPTLREQNAAKKK